jgi:predicted phosphodiesterase
LSKKEKSSSQDKKEVQESLEPSFSFIVCGDSHGNKEVYQKIIQEANESQAKFLVDLGDITRVGAESEFENFKSLVNNLKIPYYIVIGNHDVLNGDTFFKKYFGDTYYSWDCDDVHFVVLDNVTDENAFNIEQLDWLENNLQSHKDNLVFIFVHKPVKCPFISSDLLEFEGEKSEQQIDRFLNIAKKYKVDKIYSGHIHNQLDYSQAGIPIGITGGAGGPIHNVPIFGQGEFFHYILVKIEDMGYTEEVVRVEGITNN